MRYAFLIPARNAGAKLLRTLDSVLSQTSVLTGRDEVDCLILDGASNDDSLAPVEALRDPRVTILSEPDGGMYDALAKGLAWAGGDVTCYLPAGETYDPHAFSVVSEVFAEFPEIHWLTGQAVLRNAARQIVNTRLPHPYSRRFIDCGMYGTRLYGIEQESTFWRSNLNALVDLDRLRGCELAGDYFLWKSMARRHDLYVVDAQLGAFTIEPGQLSKRAPGAYRRELRRLRRPPTWAERLGALLWRQYEKRAVPRGARRLVRYDHETQVWRMD
jgi:glycosyltransferase involved in cell wall biosynthesis